MQLIQLFLNLIRLYLTRNLRKNCSRTDLELVSPEYIIPGDHMETWKSIPANGGCMAEIERTSYPSCTKCTLFLVYYELRLKLEH